MADVEEDVHATRTRHRDNLPDGRDEPGAVTQMGEQHHPGLRMITQGPIIGVDNVLGGGGFREIDSDHVNTAQSGQRLHTGLHRVIVEVGIYDRIAWLQPVVAADQSRHRFAAAPGEGDLVPVYAEQRRRAIADAGQIVVEPLPGVECGLAVDAIDVPLIDLSHAGRHGAELT